MVTEDLLKEFKDKMHISHKSEDRNLKNLLSSSIAYIADKCGKFKLDGETNIDKRAKELVLERTRYSYNDAVEFFEENFKSEIFSLGVEIAGDEDAEV